MKLWHNEVEPQGHLLDARLSKPLPVKTQQHIGMEGSRVGKRGETGWKRKKKRAVQCYVQCYLRHTLLFINKSHFIMHKTSTE
jgi:hypothetical protein